MKRKIVWLVVSGLMVLALLAASCAPKVEETAPPAEKPAAPAEAVAPAVEEKPAAPTGTEMVKVSLKKRDGTVVEKMVEKPRYGGELIVARDSSILGWDDVFFIAGNLGPHIGLSNEMLIQGDWARGPAGTGETTWTLGSWFHTDHLTGALAESWEVVQPDTLIFHIRQGVHFGLNPALEASRLVGGREITADDVVWNLRRLYFDIKGSMASLIALTARPLDVYATDKYTVVVKTPPEQIWWTLNYVSLWVTMHPPEPAKKWGDHNNWARVVGTGPFILTDYVAMSQATWVRNPNFWGRDPLLPENQLPYVDTVKQLIIPDASTRMSALRTGRVDVDTTSTIGWEDAASLQKTSPQLKYVKASGSFIIVAGRIDNPALPFKDIRVRRALMMAINYQEMVDTYYGGEAELFAFPIVPIKEWAKAYTPLEELGLAADGFDTKKTFGYHPAEAKQLLAEAGYPKGFKTEVVLGSAMVDFVSMIKAYWAEIGVDLALDVKEAGVLATMQRSHTYKEMVAASSGPAGLVHNLFWYRVAQTNNFSMVYDPKVEENFTRMGALEPWKDEWFKVLKETVIYVHHQVYHVTESPMPHTWFFWQPWVKGYQGEATVGSLYRTYPKYVWVDQELKKAMGR